MKEFFWVIRSRRNWICVNLNHLEASLINYLEHYVLGYFDSWCISIQKKYNDSTLFLLFSFKIYSNCGGHNGLCQWEWKCITYTRPYEKTNHQFQFFITLRDENFSRKVTMPCRHCVPGEEQWNKWICFLEIMSWLHHCWTPNWRH